MKVLFSGRIPKDPAFPDDNEDSYAVNADAGRIAVSDGASESFDSRTWAELLANRFVRHPVLNQSWLRSAVVEYSDRNDRESLSWSKQSAFDRGSFATLLGIRHFEKRGAVDVVAIGDSLGVLLDGHEFVDSFPYVRADEFRQRPELLCTKETLNGFFASREFQSERRRTWSVGNKLAPVLLCMTDGIAEWALRRAEEGRPVWTDLMAIRTESELETLVLRERHAKTMRVDDTTLVVASFA
jgi:Protein phosphatase 2C